MFQVQASDAFQAIYMEMNGKYVCAFFPFDSIFHFSLFCSTVLICAPCQNYFSTFSKVKYRGGNATNKSTPTIR